MEYTGTCPTKYHAPQNIGAHIQTSESTANTWRNFWMVSEDTKNMLPTFPSIKNKHIYTVFWQSKFYDGILRSQKFILSLEL